MANNLAVSNSNSLRAMSQAEILARLQGAVDKSAAVNSNFMRFEGRVGIYSYNNGSEDVSVPSGTKVYLNIFESKQGYVCWKDGKPVDTVEVSLLDVLPDEDDLTDHGPYSTDPQKREGWSMQYSLFLKGVDDNKQYILKLGSESAKREVGRLLGEIMEQAAIHDLKEQTPVVSLGAQDFKSKGFKNYKPRFEIADWADNPKQEAATGDSAAEEKAAIPASRKK